MKRNLTAILRPGLWFAFLLGAYAWAYLRLISLLTQLVWRTPFFPGRTLVYCLLGGVLIGCLRKACDGAFPNTFHEVFALLRKHGYYAYRPFWLAVLLALLPIAFGGSIGPEAGLTTSLVGLFFLLNDRYYYAEEWLPAQRGGRVSFYQGYLARLPRNFPTYVESKHVFRLHGRHKQLILLWTISVLGGLGVFLLLLSQFDTGFLFVRHMPLSLAVMDWAFLPLFVLAGWALGLLYQIFTQLTQVTFGQLDERQPLAAPILGGLLLGVLGTFYPLELFSGGDVIFELGSSYLSYRPLMLIMLSLLKLFLLALCLSSGWKGGPYFPLIFAGMSFGYAVAGLCHSNGLFAAVAVCGAMLGYLQRLPFAMTVMLLLCLPVEAASITLPAALLASLLPGRGRKEMFARWKKISRSVLFFFQHG